MDFADTAIAPGRASYGTEAVDPLKKLFQHNGIIIEVTTVPAALPIRFIPCTRKHTEKHIHALILSDNLPGINGDITGEDFDRKRLTDKEAGQPPK
ncbi:MAG: hypothetical protein ABFD45_01940 [Smithella sp.]